MQGLITRVTFRHPNAPETGNSSTRTFHNMSSGRMNSGRRLFNIFLTKDRSSARAYRPSDARAPLGRFVSSVSS